ncbi:4Fe-4S binding protein [Acetonema longum]|uniref:Putative iron-sulfur protein n=1 Tax=Acetonema longum DSM 6540 TaxID=1009370 RepID=F7NEV0_9FIRM|nr:4Fe-4S binding protein [Acetonema longum]EGO65511.1 putative iron-sulfur protein [Acetonema longum DSM 6540]
MGHRYNQDKYQLLQQRLDRTLTGAPASPVLMRILQMLFSPAEAELAAKLPGQLTPLAVLARRTGLPEPQLDEKLTDLAERGLIIDLEYNGKRYFSLAPVVIGFFEFTFMRTRDELPMAELAALFEEYMMSDASDSAFPHAVFQGETQIGRSLVREEALPADSTEILDWERASKVIEQAKSIGVSLCACRHKQSHLGQACQAPQEVCLSMNYAADILVRRGMARTVGASEALRILQKCKEAGLAQTGDNVQRNLSYICNCCGCCCSMFQSVRRLHMRGAIVTSNWLAGLDASKCRRCGKCVAACPAGAISFVNQPENGLKPSVICDESLCLGCGVCHTACPLGAISLRSRPQKVYVPETAFDKNVAMAIERGKVAELLFDQPESLSARALARTATLLEKSGPVRALLALKPVKSIFLKGLVTGAKARMKEIRPYIE